MLAGLKVPQLGYRHKLAGGVNGMLGKEEGYARQQAGPCSGWLQNYGRYRTKPEPVGRKLVMAGRNLGKVRGITPAGTWWWEGELGSLAAG